MRKFKGKRPRQTSQILHSFLDKATETVEIIKNNRILSRIFLVNRKYQLKKICSQFSVELLMLIVLLTVSGANLSLWLNSQASYGRESLFFAYLKTRPELNLK